MHPLARRHGLTVQELADETLVYIPDSHRAHCLNRPASVVWRHCDGRTPVAELAQILGRELNVAPDERVAELMLHELRQAQLLEICPPLPPRSVSRRRLLAQLGISLVAAPAILSVTAPRAHAQASPAVQRLLDLLDLTPGGGDAPPDGGADAPPDGGPDAPPDGPDGGGPDVPPDVPDGGGPDGPPDGPDGLLLLDGGDV
jgi:hypothetical protein